MDEGRLEDILREGPPFATAYVARPMVLDDVPARRDAPTARRLLLVVVTVGLLLGAAFAALVVAGFLRPSDPGPLALIRGGALFVVPTDGSPDREILPSAPDGHGDWCPPELYGQRVICGSLSLLGMSPDGGRLVLRVNRGQVDNGQYASVDLYVVNADGSGLRLMHGAPGDPSTIDLAPDGRRVAYTVGETRAHGRQMVVVDLDAGGVTTLPDGFGPRWSPNGELIAYTTLDKPGTDVLSGATWVVGADGTQPRRVAERAGLLGWSADSRSLFEQNLIERQPLSVAVDGSPERVALTWNVPNPSGCSWQCIQTLLPSPDGRHVAMILQGNAESNAIAISDPDGSHPVEIATTQQGRLVTRMCWSDDGRWLVWEEGGGSLASESGSLASYIGMILAYNDVDSTTQTLVSGWAQSPGEAFAIPGQCSA